MWSECIVYPYSLIFYYFFSFSYAFDTIMIVIDMLTYFMDKKCAYHIVRIVKFLDRGFRIQSNNSHYSIS